MSAARTQWRRWAASIAAMLLLDGAAPARSEPPATAPAEPQAADDEAVPAALNPEYVTQWWGYGEISLHQLRESQREIDLAHGNEKTPRVAAEDLLRGLDDTEQRFKALVITLSWHKAARLAPDTRPASRRELFRLMQERARMNDAVTRAAAKQNVHALPERAWMSKAGIHPELERFRKVRAAMLADAARELYPLADAGSWEREAIASFKLARDSGPLTLHRRARTYAIETGAAMTFNRLDLVETGDKPAAFEHAWLGRIDVPANSIVCVWDLPALLTPAAKTEMDNTALRALAGDEKAAEQIESALPLTHAALRAALARDGDAPGAPRLRMLLTLFDDVPPVPPEPSK